MAVIVKSILTMRNKNPRLRASLRPALIRKAVGTIVAENNMVEDGDADEVAGLTEPGGENTIFRTGFRVAGWMIVRTNDRGAIQEDRRFEDFARMDDAERQ